jgi:arginine/lysine/ornithine decarboxylase
MEHRQMQNVYKYNGIRDINNQNKKYHLSNIQKKSKKNTTPIVDFLLSNKDNLNANFHALPIFSMQPGMKDYEKYRKVYGSKYFSTETTLTGKIFDSFFYPTRCIKKSQDYAAELFGANDTLFITCGTSISNQIVVDALIEETSCVLLDREAHQSMHFALKNTRAKFDYFYSSHFCIETERKYIKIDSLLKKIKEAVENKQPYDVVVLSAASYDGIIYNIYEIIRKIVGISPSTKFIVDEAWSSAFYFHPKLYQFTAGYAAKKLGDKVNIVSTQSAHKSLMALRQASFIHSFANKEITDKLYKSRFKYHSTSPSYAILASMELARAHMQNHGENLLQQALDNADYLRRELKKDTQLSSLLYISDQEKLALVSDGICLADPLKIHLNIKDSGYSGSDLQEYLYHHFGIYFNRYTDSAILINIHIGITKEHIDVLIKALKSALSLNKSKDISIVDEKDFIILYPPGIPLHAPGEFLDHRKLNSDIKNKVKRGINVFHLT